MIFIRKPNKQLLSVLRREGYVQPIEVKPRPKGRRHARVRRYVRPVAQSHPSRLWIGLVWAGVILAALACLDAAQRTAPTIHNPPSVRK